MPIVFHNVSLNIPDKWKHEIYEEDFDPHRAQQYLQIICGAYFADNPVTTDPAVNFCNSTFDSFSCWPSTAAGYTAVVSCPDVSIADTSFNATKLCQENGTWATAFYEDCFVDESKREGYPLSQYNGRVSTMTIYNVGYIITTIALVAALCIFMYFKSLRCLRNSIHCNLIVGFILNNIMWLLTRYTLKIIHISGPKWSCKVMMLLLNYFHSAAFYWMFVEGLYLFTIIVWAFSAQTIRLWYYLIIGWGAPMVVTLIWALVKAYIDDNVCWLPLFSYWDYIFHVPVLLLLASNLFFMIAIIWVLVTKMRASNALETRQSRKAVKATVVLVPLLGLTYVLFLYQPDEPTIKDIFKHINACLQSFQGFFVALFYCFLNGEVQSILRQKIAALQDSRTLSRYTKSSVFNSPRRSSYAMTACNGKGGAKRACGGGSQSRVSKQGEAETEASAAMMDNML